VIVRIALKAEGMNSIVAITYIGVITAILIIAWIVFIMTQRTRTRMRKKPAERETWVPLKPHPADLLEDPMLETDEPALLDQQVRAKQNGHYSHQKKNI